MGPPPWFHQNGRLLTWKVYWVDFDVILVRGKKGKISQNERFILAPTNYKQTFIGSAGN